MNNPYELIINTKDKYFETGSDPCYFNLNNTAKDYFVVQDSTSPEGCYLDLLNRNFIIENQIILSKPSEQ